MRWRSRPEAVKQADRAARSRAPDRRLVETASGVLAIRLNWTRWSGISVVMTLYGADGWPADARSWAEQFQTPERDQVGTLPEVISAWTGMSPVDAEAFVEETVSRWRQSSAFEEDVKFNRWSILFLVALAILAVLALVGLAALVWVIVSALT